jgi:hypothetical protein
MVLTGIAEEKEYSEIPFFKDFLVTRNLNFHIVVEPIHLSSNFPFKEVLQERATFDSFDNIYELLHDDEDDLFSHYIIMPIVGYSLAEFLVHNDRRKIKQCPYCQNFFIAKDIKRKKCYSDECFKEHERLKKQKQRGKDPAKYV